MDKPDWCKHPTICGWFGCEADNCRQLKCKYYKPILNPLIEEFVRQTNERFKQ